MRSRRIPPDGFTIRMGTMSPSSRSISRKRSGKGRRERISYLSPKAVKAVDRHLRARRSHPHSHTPWLWLGEKGPPSDSGIVQTLKRRGREVGVTGFHAHSARHWYAHEAMSAGPVEGEIMALAVRQVARCCHGMGRPPNVSER
jgi:integrase